MLDVLLAVGLAILIGIALLLLIWGLLALVSAVAGIEILNSLLERCGFSRASPEGHTPGQRHTAEVASAFRFDPARGYATGTVQLHGEIWNADCPEALAETLREGMPIEVVYGDDLRVRVVVDAT